MTAAMAAMRAATAAMMTTSCPCLAEAQCQWALLVSVWQRSAGAARERQVELRLQLRSLATGSGHCSGLACGSWLRCWVAALELRQPRPLLTKQACQACRRSLLRLALDLV